MSDKTGLSVIFHALGLFVIGLFAVVWVGYLATKQSYDSIECYQNGYDNAFTDWKGKSFCIWTNPQGTVYKVPLIDIRRNHIDYGK